MAKQTTSAQSINQSSLQPAFVTVLFDAEIGAARVLVPDGATVEYDVLYVEHLNRYCLMVWINNGFVGWHCGERSREVIEFTRESDALRLADVRNAAWASRRSVEVVA